MRTIHHTPALLALVLLLQGAGQSRADGPYQADWESLARHRAAPEWLKDAKLGIYFHWGPYTVPAYATEWYPRWMFWDAKYFAPFDQSKVFEHHVSRYGHPSEFGYHDFIPMFTGEHFDAEEWAELFQQAGARFAGPVAEHHDGFSMWASKITPWNAQERGPKRDVLGELFQALQRCGLKRIATFHHERNLQRLNADTYRAELDRWATTNPRRYGSESHFPYLPGMPTVSDDPELQLLYGNMPADEWHEEVWLGKLKEVIDMYQPDIIWFDSWLDLIPESHRQRFCAYYLNAAHEQNRDVAIIRKQDDLPLSFTMNDHEKSREPKAIPELWMTDDTLSTHSWSYTSDMELKPLDMIVHSLIDTVSKNGVMLLNISPRSDGVIPDDQRERLLGLGGWLRRNGEAIYATRPWRIAAEGPTSEPDGGFAARSEFLNLRYSAQDIRYTASKDGKTVYAMTLGRPEEAQTLLLKSFADGEERVADVSLVTGQQVQWEQTERGLSVSAPPTSADEIAVAFKISLK